MTREQAAIKPLYLALSPDLEGVSGEYFVKNNSSGPTLLSYNDSFAIKVWEASENLVGQYFEMET